MSDWVTMDVSGLHELGEAFLQLPSQLQVGADSPLRAGVREAANVFKVAARDLVHFNPKDGDPHIRDRIIIAYDRHGPADGERYVVMVAYRTRKYRNNRLNRRLGRVGNTWQDFGDLFYWRILEFGLPGYRRAFPFMRPAFDANVSAAVDAFELTFVVKLNTVLEKWKRSFGPKT